jgi:hypothetical protein
MGGCGGQWGRQGGNDDESLPSPNNFYGSTFIKIEGSLTDYRSSLGPTWTPNQAKASLTMMTGSNLSSPQPTHPSLPPLPPPTPSPSPSALWPGLQRAWAAARGNCIRALFCALDVQC